MAETAEGRAADGVRLTEQERAVLEALATAWNLFIDMDPQTGETLRDFCDAIHRCQDQIALRVAARADPDVWDLGERGRRL